MAMRRNYRFLSTNKTVQTGHTHTNSFEFEESDIWGGVGADLPHSNSNEYRSPPPTFRKPRKPNSNSNSASLRKCGGGREAMSVPVNVPDWSKILRQEYKDKWSDVNFGGFDDGDDVEWVPPHEYLARTRNASFSVQEGIGRTLKGRDLSRVRNAIWEKTGFQD